MSNTTSKSCKLFTIGYASHTNVQFIEALKANDIRLVIDVRTSPVSQVIWANGRKMRELLNQNGMSYRHYPALGGRPSDPTLYIDNDKTKGVDYEKLIGSMPFVEAINRVIAGMKTMKELKKPINIAFLCMEQRKEDCHRWNAVAKAFKKLRYKVEEIEYPSAVINK